MKRRKRIIALIISWAFILSVFTACGRFKIVYEDDNNSVNQPETIEADSIGHNVESDNANEQQDASDSSVVSNMRRGISIGNSLDCYDEWNENAIVSETYWGNPEISEAYINKLIEAGFDTIRIPVTWSAHIINGTVDPSFMSRVREVVDYAYNSGAYVILDVHHDKKFAPSYGNYNFARDYLEFIWTNIANEFKDYGEKLIFEGINEPRLYGSSDEWTEGTVEGSDNVNKLMSDFVDIVRSTGGNNATRLLLVTCYCNRAGGLALERMVVPEDDNIAISIHSYDPYDFTSSTGYREFNDNVRQDLDYTLSNLKHFVKSQKIPVIITEYGVYESVGKEGRIDYIKYFTHELDEVGIPCIWWDNGLGYGNGAYGLFDRNTTNVFDQETVDAIIKGN